MDTPSLHDAARRDDVEMAAAVVDELLAQRVPLRDVVDATYDDLMRRAPLLSRRSAATNLSCVSSLTEARS